MVLLALGEFLFVRLLAHYSMLVGLTFVHFVSPTVDFLERSPHYYLFGLSNAAALGGVQWLL